tara:strand:+ start:166 stop:663 length:498 start_codon:yes stop_codon:yes gene_type:complete
MALQFDPAMLQGPIPGMSLTKEPQEAPWENPPELSTIQDVIDFYTEKMLGDEIEDAILVALDEGLSVERMAEFISTSGTMNGRHSLDLAFLVDPYVRELIRYVADSADVDYVDSYGEREAKKRVPYRQIRTVIKEMYDTKQGAVVTDEDKLELPKGLMAKINKEE